MAVTEQQAQFYARNGYLKYGKLLEMDDVEQLRAALHTIAAAEADLGDDTSPEFHAGHLRKSDPRPERIPMYVQYVNVWKREAAFARTIRDPRITAVAQALLHSDAVRLWHDHIISKPPHESRHFSFHQDFYGWPLSDPRIVSCWIALDDATAANGCMHVIPQSHQDPRFAPEAWQRERELTQKDLTCPTARAAVEQQPASVGVPVELETGECMFHHCLNFHATPENTTDHQRRAFVIIFMADGVRYQNDRAPTHPLVPLISVADGAPLSGKDFPLVAS